MALGEGGFERGLWTRKPKPDNSVVNRVRRRLSEKSGMTRTKVWPPPRGSLTPQRRLKYLLRAAVMA